VTRSSARVSPPLADGGRSDLGHDLVDRGRVRDDARTRNFAISRLLARKCGGRHCHTGAFEIKRTLPGSGKEPAAVAALIEKVADEVRSAVH
jgi:hypothetical protein